MKTGATETERNLPPHSGIKFQHYTRETQRPPDSGFLQKALSSLLVRGVINSFS